MRTSSLLVLMGVGGLSFTSALPTALPEAPPIPSSAAETQSDPVSPSRFHSAPETNPPEPLLIIPKPTPPSAPPSRPNWQTYTPPPALPKEAQAPLRTLHTEESPEIFPLSCSVSAYAGGDMVLHWVQADGSCKSRLEVRRRGLFRMREDGETVLVGEEAM